jgi:hypothetical protein
MYTDNLDPLLTTLVTVRHSRALVSPNLVEGGTCGWRGASTVVSRTAIRVFVGVTSHVAAIMMILIIKTSRDDVLPPDGT